MIIIALRANTGNQMFQYALYRAFQSKGLPVKLDDFSFFTWPDGLGPAGEPNSIKKAFRLDYDSASVKELLRMWEYPYPVLGKLPVLMKKVSFFRYKMTAFLRIDYKNVYYDPEHYDPSVFDLENKYLNGYWQSEKYFSDPIVQEELRRDFAPPRQVIDSESFKKWRDRISSVKSCSVHFRRTDYLTPENARKYVTFDDSYYDRAMDHIIRNAGETTFFLFSDDKDYLKEKYSDSDYVIVDDPRLTYLDEFYLMSSCDHHILANSSFSWWSAWLGKREGTMNLVPDRWLLPNENPDIYSPWMTKIPSRSSTV